MQYRLIDRLRQATAAQHSHIEGVLALDRPFSLEHYTRVLQVFESFLRAWEPRVEQALPPALREWFRQRCRGDFVRADLEALRAKRLDEPARLPSLPGASAAMGSLYVMEGSTLGGQVIARQVNRQFGFTPESGAAYFHGWGAKTGAMWKEFQQVLDEHDQGGADAVAASSAAVQTFEALARSFSRGAHVR